MFDDTIAAIATPLGQGGIGIVRLSGAQSLAIARRIFRPHRPGRFRSHRLRYGHIIDPATNTRIDEALCVIMRAPRSFTREDVVELSCHGGAVVLQQTLALVLAEGARLAEPGEFTLRAFLHGRIDLSQAEATLDIIQAQTTTALALAQAQLGGWLAHEIRRLRRTLLDVLAAMTVLLDFPEDEVDVPDWSPDLIETLHTIERLVATADHGIIYRRGARAVLVGRPNVGKSSLLNRLLCADRAIVTPIPGTTRDTLEETANIHGIPLVLIDTAGITESENPIEQLGVERSHTALATCDIVLLLLDSTASPTTKDIAIAQLTLEKPTVIIWTKADLGGQPHPLSLDHPHLLGHVLTSVVTDQGIETLTNLIRDTLLGDGLIANAETALLITNPRHHDALRRAASALHATLDTQAPTDVLAGEVTLALNALGEITGETVGDDLLHTIFSRFCIGK